MGVIFHKNKKYGGTGVKVQSDPAATSLNALEVPNGQTMTSYLNSNFVKKSGAVGTPVTIPNNGTEYTTLSDGWFRVGVTGSATGSYQGFAYAGSTLVAFLAGTRANTSVYSCQTVYVKKGMKLSVASLSAQEGYFYPCT